MVELTFWQRLRLRLGGAVYLERFKKWLASTWTCINCGKKYHLYCFGYGSVICPDCYKGEHPWLFPDESFILNRIVFPKRYEK